MGRYKDSNEECVLYLDNGKSFKQESDETISYFSKKWWGRVLEAS